MRALLLSGGAFRGAVQLPVIEHLAKTHEYDFVYGVSVGSINGIMFAQKELGRLRDFWENVNGISDFLTLRWWWPLGGFYSMKPLRKKLEENISLAKVKIPFAAGMVSLTNGQYYNILSEDMHSDQHLWSIIEASSAIPGIMVPPKVQIGNVTHTGADGGLRNIIPVPPSGAYEHIDIVTCKPIFKIPMHDTQDNLLDYVSRDVEIMEDEIFHRDIQEIRGKCGTRPRITIYSPPEDTMPSFQADKETILKRFELGYRAIQNPLVLN